MIYENQRVTSENIERMVEVKLAEGIERATLDRNRIAAIDERLACEAARLTAEHHRIVALEERLAHEIERGGSRASASRRSKNAWLTPRRLLAQSCRATPGECSRRAADVSHGPARSACRPLILSAARRCGSSRRAKAHGLTQLPRLCASWADSSIDFIACFGTWPKYHGRVVGGSYCFPAQPHVLCMKLLPRRDAAVGCDPPVYLMEGSFAQQDDELAARQLARGARTCPGSPDPRRATQTPRRSHPIPAMMQRVKNSAFDSEIG